MPLPGLRDAARKLSGIRCSSCDNALNCKHFQFIMLSLLQMARGIIAVGMMLATSISKTTEALGGALNNYASSAMHRSPPLSEPLTLSKSYVSRCVCVCSHGAVIGASCPLHPVHTH
jgi:hypothetical protein